MISKERVLTAFAHQVPDRVPIDYSANPGIDAKLKKHFGLTKDNNDELLKALNVDFRYVAPPYVGPALHEKIPNRQISVFGARMRWIEHESGGYWDFCDFPLKNADLEQVESWPFPSPNDFDYSIVAKLCKRYKDYCIVIGDPSTGDIINSAGMLFTMEEVLVNLILDNEACLRFIDRKNETQLEIIRRSIEAANGEIDLLFLGEDLGTQIAPIISLDLFRKHIRPRHQKFVNLAKHYKLPVMIHCCGSSSWAFDDFIDMGINIVDTLQPEAEKMEPKYLKKKFGQKLAFHGCISTAGPVAYGSVQEAIDYVHQTLEIMKPEGGYAFAPTHDLQDNSSVENVVAMYNSVLKFGRY